ncbi:MAG TPA: nuclease-related domain-containing protein [Arthrobacter sp.]
MPGSRRRPPAWTVSWLLGVIAIVFLTRPSTSGLIWWVAIAAAPAWISWRRRPKPIPAATDFLRLEVLLAGAHGVPGRGLTVQLFGANAAPGIEGEQRTARLIEASVLPGLPAARLINGVRWPGTRAADIDHVIIAGNRIAVIDSKLWAEGKYSWDNSRLLRDGVEMEPFKLVAAVNALRAKFPGFEIHGWVVLHSRSGDPNKPFIAPNSDPWRGGTGVALVSAAALPLSVRTFLASGPQPHLVDVRALQHLLSGMV